MEGGRETRGYRVYGRVQGVGFRWWVRREARKLGLVGAVRNEIDGSVQVVAAGAGEALDALERRLEEGPPGARVDGLELGETTLPLPDGDFRIVH